MNPPQRRQGSVVRSCCSVARGAFRRLQCLAVVLLFSPLVVQADFSGPYALTPPAPGVHVVDGFPGREWFLGGWRARGHNSALVSIDTSSAPEVLILDSQYHTRYVGATMFSTSQISGTVSFDYVIDGQGGGEFRWFRAGPNYYYGAVSFQGVDTNLVSTPTHVSFDVQAGENIGFIIYGGPWTTTLGDSGQRIVTISNFSVVASTSLLSVTDVLVTEPTTGTNNAVFTVSLVRANTETVTVEYGTIDESATHGTDFQAVTGSLTFLAGETNKTISVAIFPDATAEGVESFSVGLTNAVGARLFKGSGRGTINDLQITAISFHVDISFSSVSQAQYRVEYSEDAVTWTAVPGATNVVGTGQILTVTDPNAACRPNRNYRVRLL